MKIPLTHLHIYRTGSDGEPITTKRDANMPGAVMQTLRDDNFSKDAARRGMRGATLWRSQNYALTRNVSPLEIAKKQIDHWIKQASNRHDKWNRKSYAQWFVQCWEDPSKRILDVTHLSAHLRINQEYYNLKNRARYTLADLPNKHMNLRWQPSAPRHSEMTCLPPIPPHIKILNLCGMNALTEAPDFSQCVDLEAIVMNNLRSLNAPLDFSACKKLRRVYMADCTSLTIPPNFEGCDALEFLDMRGVPAARDLRAHARAIADATEDGFNQIIAERKAAAEAPWPSWLPYEEPDCEIHIGA